MKIFSALGIVKPNNCIVNIFVIMLIYGEHGRSSIIARKVSLGISSGIWCPHRWKMISDNLKA